MQVQAVRERSHECRPPRLLASSLLDITTHHTWTESLAEASESRKGVPHEFKPPGVMGGCVNSLSHVLHTVARR